MNWLPGKISTTNPALRHSASYWPTGLTFFLLLALVYLQPVQSLVSDWWTHPFTYSHGFVVPVISGYLLWLRREDLADSRRETSALGLIPFCLGIVLLVIGTRGEEDTLTRISIPISLWGSLCLLFGWQVAKVALIPIACLFFMIPLPYTLNQGIAGHLQLLDAELASRLLTILGIPLFVDGVLLHLPNVTLEIASLCSGIQSLTALLPLGFIYVYNLKLPQRRKWPLYFLAIPVSILANVVRIVITAALAYHYGSQWALSFPVHAFTGSFNFLFAFVILVILCEMTVAVLNLSGKP